MNAESVERDGITHTQSDRMHKKELKEKIESRGNEIVKESDNWMLVQVDNEYHHRMYIDVVGTDNWVELNAMQTDLMPEDDNVVIRDLDFAQLVG